MQPDLRPKMKFEPFRKIARLSREVIVTEKIDGTNGIIGIDDDGTIFVGSRSRWFGYLYPTSGGVFDLVADNHGFFEWASRNREDLLRLGPGIHHGEWWGQGIQRGYGLKEKRFSLFNVTRWQDDAARPACCCVVPEIWRGDFDTIVIDAHLKDLARCGSWAAPGFMRPEGVVIFHAQGNVLFKKTIEGDEQGKGAGN